MKVRKFKTSGYCMTCPEYQVRQKINTRIRIVRIKGFKNQKHFLEHVSKWLQKKEEKLLLNK